MRIPANNGTKLKQLFNLNHKVEAPCLNIPEVHHKYTYWSYYYYRLILLLSSLQTPHVYSTLKRRFNVECTWCVCRIIISNYNNVSNFLNWFLISGAYSCKNSKLRKHLNKQNGLFIPEDALFTWRMPMNKIFKASHVCWYVFPFH